MTNLNIFGIIQSRRETVRTNNPPSAGRTKGERTMAYTATYEGGGLYRIFANGKCIGIVDGRRIDWNKVTVVKAA